MKTVAELIDIATVAASVTYLTDLQQGRYGHACSKYVDTNGQTVSFSQ